MTTSRIVTGGLGSLGAGLLMIAGACASTPEAIVMPGPGFEQGAELYINHCAACHGAGGRGDGEMTPFLRVAPRNFREDKFRFISASTGEMATEDDIIRYVRLGSRPSLMPANPQLSTEQLTDLAAYVREFRKFGVMDEIEQSFIEDDEEYTQSDLEEIAADRMVAAPGLVVPQRPTAWRTDHTRGAELFATNCAACHGPQGRGDGSEELLDDRGRPIRARDLARGEYRGGALDRDLFWRIRCGIPGTPMPSLQPSVVPDEDVWQLVDYLRFLAVPR